MKTNSRQSGRRNQQAPQDKIMKSPLHEFVRLILSENVTYHELVSPLKYARGGDVKRLAYCDPSVTEPPKHHDAYFVDYQRMVRYGKRGQRLKTPRKGEFIPGVSNVCIIGFLDYAQISKTRDGGTYWFIHYMKTRQDKQGRGVATKLMNEFFKRHVKPGDVVDLGKMMREEIHNIKDKMEDKYPDATVVGSVYY